MEHNFVGMASSAPVVVADAGRKLAASADCPSRGVFFAGAD